jgi:hypothetical protein
MVSGLTLNCPATAVAVGGGVAVPRGVAVTVALTGVPDPFPDRAVADAVGWTMPWVADRVTVLARTSALEVGR